MTLEQDYSVNEVAKALGMSAQWVRERINRDGAEHQRYGHVIRFTAAQVDKLRADNTRNAIPQSITTGKRKSA